MKYKIGDLVQATDKFLEDDHKHHKYPKTFRSRKDIFNGKFKVIRVENYILSIRNVDSGKTYTVLSENVKLADGFKEIFNKLQEENNE